MSSTFNLDGKGILIDKLSQNREGFENSNLILSSKKSLEAIKRMYGLENDLLKFAHDPSTKNDPALPDMPIEPDTTDMPEEMAQKAQEDYNRLKVWWDLVKEAHELKVPMGQYMHIMKYMSKWKHVLNATPAIKGKRFFALTKNVADEKKGGLLDALRSGDN